MATVAELKGKARELERQGQIDKALAVYRHVLKHLEGRPALEAELPLFVKVGDLEWKQGRPDEAVAMYERAAARYVTRGVAASVVALCVKILRVDPARTAVFRRFARALLDAGYVGPAREVLLDYAQRVRRDTAVAALQRVADRPDDEVRAALERLLGPAGAAASGPRPAIDAPPPPGGAGVTASGPRPAVEPPVAASGPRPGVPKAATGPRPAIDAAPRRAVPVDVPGSGPRQAVAVAPSASGPRPVVAPGVAASGPRPGLPAKDVSGARPAALDSTASSGPRPVRFSPSREAEALDRETGPASVPVQPAAIRTPFLPHPPPKDAVEEEDERPAPPAPRVAPPERRRAFAGTAREAERRRLRKAWPWVAGALVVLAAAAAALGYFGLVPLDVRDLAASVGIGRAAADRPAGGAGFGPASTAPIAVSDSLALPDSSAGAGGASRDALADSTTTGRPAVPAARSAPMSAESTPSPQAIRPLGPPPSSDVPVPVDTTPEAGSAAERYAGDSLRAGGRGAVGAADPVQLPAGVSASGPVVVVPGLAIASLDESPTGHEVVHRLAGGELLRLSASRFGGGATEAPSPSAVRVTTVPGDTAIGSARVGEYMVSARAYVAPDALQALLRRLVVVEPAGSR